MLPSSTAACSTKGGAEDTSAGQRMFQNGPGDGEPGMGGRKLSVVEWLAVVSQWPRGSCPRKSLHVFPATIGNEIDKRWVSLSTGRFLGDSLLGLKPEGLVLLEPIFNGLLAADVTAGFLGFVPLVFRNLPDFLLEALDNFDFCQQVGHLDVGAILGTLVILQSENKEIGYCRRLLVNDAGLWANCVVSQFLLALLLANGAFSRFFCPLLGKQPLIINGL